MRSMKTLLAVLITGALSLGAGMALAATAASTTPAVTTPSAIHVEKTVRIHRVRGEVTAVEPGAKTMLVKAMVGKKELTVGVDITDKTIIREGKVGKTLKDIKVGDRVWMKYEKTSDKLVADSIRILKPAKMAATK